MLVRAEAVRWVDDEPWPGLVEVVLTDADGRGWSLVEKAPVFDADRGLRPGAAYPLPVLIACNLIERRTDASGRRTALIDLLPWGVTTQTYEVTVDLLEPGDSADLAADLPV